MSSSRRLHRASSTPVATAEENEGDTYTHNVDAAVHSIIADMEEGDDGHGDDDDYGDDDDDYDDDDLDFHGDDTEMLFVRSTDPTKMASSSNSSSPNSSSSQLMLGGTLADHEDELLAEVNSSRAFRGNKRGGKKCPRWNIGNSCSVGCVPIVLIFGFLIVVASVMISYANNLARTHGLHGPVVQGLNHAVPAPPPDLTLVCSEHFYHDVR
jgi:hypothetical protein